MQKYVLSDLKLGSTASFEAKITAEKMQKFLEISGDVNPMHLDETYAQSKGMTGRVVYGMLTASFYSTLVGVYLPGKHALLHAIDIQFSKPVFIGDKLTIEGLVSDIHETFQQIEVKAKIINQHGIKISRAKIKIGFII